MKEPPTITTPPEQDDTGKLPSKQSAPAMDPSNPMSAFFGMMAQMMNNPDMMQNMQNMMGNNQDNQDGQQQSNAPVIKKVDPETDPELQQRMHQNLESQGARHINHAGVGDAVVSVEHGGMDEMLNEAEAEAQAEINAFKRLPKDKQTSAGSLVVENDISPEDMEEFRKIQKRTDRNAE